jgi:putative membrane protein
MKPTRGIAATVAVSALLAGSALAQNSQQAPLQPPSSQTGTPTPSTLPKAGTVESGTPPTANAAAENTEAPVKASDYVNQTAMTDLFEIRAGEIAREKATTPAIRSFAQRMINEHTTSSKNLTRVVQSENVNLAPPGKLDREHWALLRQLRRTSGANFDRTYLKTQADGHRKALALQEAYSRNGDDSKLKQLATEETNVVKSHLDELKQIDQTIASQ